MLILYPFCKMDTVYVKKTKAMWFESNRVYFCKYFPRSGTFSLMSADYRVYTKASLKVVVLLLALVRSLHTRAHIRWNIFTKMNYTRVDFVTYFSFLCYFCDQLSHYLDIVEVQIAKQISMRSNAFFTAMASHDALQEHLASTCKAIKQLR